MWLAIILVVLSYLKLTESQRAGESPYGYSWVEMYHDPHKLTTELPRLVNGSAYEIPDPKLESPDYRLPEPPWTSHKDYFYKESYRPYRLNPFIPIQQLFNKYLPMEHAYLLGCACCVVFKRMKPVSTCALLTSRHALTSATAIEVVLRKYGHKETLENILGFWYEVSGDYSYNSSHYASIARIHYHDKYNWPDRTNRSHPLPCIYDLAILATTYNVRGDYPNVEKAIFCNRGVSTSRHYASTTHRWMEAMHFVGYQFIWYINRVPTPFHKYMVRGRGGSFPVCPKSEWGWYHCVESRTWGTLGFDLGGLKFLQLEFVDHRSSGLVGVNALSMKLRSWNVVHYFTVLDRYTVLDWLYAAYMGRQKYRWLDRRFQDTQFAAPRLKPWLWIPKDYHKPDQHQLYVIPQS